MENALKIQSYAKNCMDVDIDLFNDVNQAFDVVINTTPLGMYEQEDKHDFFTIPLHNNSKLIDFLEWVFGLNSSKKERKNYSSWIVTLFILLACTFLAIYNQLYHLNQVSFL